VWRGKAATSFSAGFERLTRVTVNGDFYEFATLVEAFVGLSI